jgi:hypothetical protein
MEFFLTGVFLFIEYIFTTEFLFHYRYCSTLYGISFYARYYLMKNKLRRAVRYKFIEVSKERKASIFMVHKLTAE